MRRVLIATEGASCSPEAVRHFISLFGKDDLTVFILAVIPAANATTERHPSDYYRWESEEALVALDRAASSLAQAGFAAFSLLRIGEPAQSILSVASDLDADMIVLGTHGGRGIKRLIRGSVAEAVLYHAPCGVMIHPLDMEGDHAPEDHPAA